MSGKLNKKNVIAIIVIVILAIIAITGTVVFLKDRGSTEATEILSEGNQSQGSTSDSNSGTTTGQAENNNGQNGEEPQTTDNNQQQGTVDAEGQNADTANNNQGAAETTDNQGNAGTANVNSGNAGTASAGTTENAQTQTTQNAGVDNIQGTTITRVTEGDDIKVADDRNIGWTPMSIQAELASAKINADRSDIQVNKKATTKTGTNVVRPGEEITYTLEVTNNSEEELKNVEVSDKIPANTTYVETDDNAQKIKDADKSIVGLKWYINMKAGETVGIQFKVKVNENVTGSISNVAIANGEPSEEVKTAIIKQEKTSIITRTIDKEEAEVDQPAKVGDEITYTISVINTGDIEGTTTVKDADLENILSDEKAEMVGNVSIFKGEEKVADDKTAQDLINGIKDIVIPANGEAKVVFTIKVKKIEGKIINIATVGDEEEKPTEPEEVDTMDYEVIKTVISEDRDKDGKYDLGETIEYEVKVKNNGSTTLINVIVRDPLDADTTYTIRTIEPETTEIAGTFSYTVQKVDILAGKVLNQATAQVPGEEEIPSNEVETSTEEQNKAIEVTKTVISEDNDKDGKYDLGETIEYEVKAKNNGNVVLTGITVKDPLDSNTTYTVNDLEPGATKTAGTFSYTVQKADILAGKVLNQATAQVPGEEETPSNEVETPTEEQNKAIEVTKTVISEDNDKDGKYDLGETIEYEVKVKNNGNVVLTGITVRDPLDPNTTYTVNDLEPGATKTAGTFSYTVQEADIVAGKVLNQATAQVPGEQETPSNEVETPTEEANPSPEIQKDLKAITIDGETTYLEGITIDGIKVTQGDTVTYKIVATNNGNTTLTAVKISDDTRNVKLETVELPERLAGTTITTGNTITKGNNLLGRNDITLEPEETITLTVSYTLQKSDVMGTNYQKDFVNVATVKGTFNNKQYTDNDDATIGTEFTPTTGSKEFVKVWNDTNYESCRPESIEIQLLKNGKAEGNKISITAKDNWSYKWNNLPLEDTDGQTITYSVQETPLSAYTTSVCTTNAKGQLTITNTYKKPIKGTITKNYTTTSTTRAKVPIDVVFVLDTSGSMKDNNRAKSMVSAVNSAVTTILGYNEYNRIGIVGYSGTSDRDSDMVPASTLLELGRYTPQSYQNNIGNYLTLSNNKIYTNVTGNTKNSREVKGATYTQIGIRKGAEMLTSSTEKTITIDGKQVTRTPVIILLSDGEPTLYTSKYNDVKNENRVGGGNFDNMSSDERAEAGYYTILSANYYKSQVTKSYGTDTQMYTIAMDMTKTYGVTVLNPNATNIQKCASSGNNTEAKKLYNYLTNGYNGTANPYAGKYNYADEGFAGEMTEDQLKNIMEKVITNTQPNEETWSITATEIANAKVNLPDIDINGEFTLTAGTANYSTCQQASDAGVLQGNETSGYYLDLTKLPAGATITVSYTAK